MCFGCTRESIVEGRWTRELPEKIENEEFKEYYYCRHLADASRIPDENLVDDLVLKELYNEDNIKYRREEAIRLLIEEKKENSIMCTYCNVRDCVVHLVLGHTIGSKKTKEIYKDDLAIKVIKQIEEDFESHDDKLSSSDVYRYTFFYSISGNKSEFDKKYLIAKALPYAIIYEIVSYFQLYELISRENFFNRPFVKYVMEGKENKTELDEYWIEKIKNKWDKKEEMNSKK
jgi:hypothetical protein